MRVLVFFYKLLLSQSVFVSRNRIRFKVKVPSVKTSRDENKQYYLTEDKKFERFKVLEVNIDDGLVINKRNDVSEKTKLINMFKKKKTKQNKNQLKNKLREKQELFKVEFKNRFESISKTIVKKTIIVNSEENLKNLKNLKNHENHENFALMIMTRRLIVCNAMAGVGKTYTACKVAAKMLENNQIKAIVITRPISTVAGEQLGFIPGNIDDKMSPFSRPIIEALSEILTPQKVKSLLTIGKIKIQPIGHIRGLTFKDTILICDEMQNADQNQMESILTRVGINTKVVVIGDSRQQDTVHSIKDGLSDLVSRIDRFHPTDESKKTHEIAICKFTIEDVRRDPFTKHILELYNMDS
jgi:phosphate starvation-inducible PhoH-like protein